MIKSSHQIRPESKKIIRRLHEEYYYSLYLLFYNWKGKSNLTLQDFEDAVSEVFAKLCEIELERLLKIVNSDYPFGYLAKILRNNLIDKVRKNQKSSEFFTEKVIEHFECSISTYSELEYNELLEVLKHKLSNVDYEIIFLLVQGYTSGEIGDLLGKSSGAAYAAIHRARTKVANLVFSTK